METVFQSSSDLKETRANNLKQVLKAYSDGSYTHLESMFLYDDMGFLTDVGDDQWTYDSDEDMLFDAQNTNKDGSLIPVTEAMFRDEVVGDLKVYSVSEFLETDELPSPICVIKHHEFLIAKLETRVRQLEAKIRGNVPESIAPDVMDIVLEHERYIKHIDGKETLA